MQRHWEPIAFVNAGEVWLLKARAVARRVGERFRAAVGRRGAVLVVENDPGTRDVLGTLLRQEGYSVQEARDGREALDLLRAGPRPDCIILDLLMRRMGGRQFRAEQLRDPSLRHIPVLVLSGEPGAPREAAEMGAAACLGKPLDFDAVLGALWKQC
jgi:CheY-like chemotaxis protein